MRVNVKWFLSATALIAGLALNASAQVTEKKSLTLDGARQVIAAAKAEAKRLNAPGGVIAVVDDGGNLMALERLDGTFAAGANISIGKARTAVQFKRPTRFFEELINSSGKGRTVMTALNDFTPLIGGVPVMVDGQVVGGVGVSGAASAQQDEELAIAGANSLAGLMASAAPVSYFPSADVTAAFAKGAVLLGEEAGRNYMVHASRREAPGLAEVHTLDTDILYVLDGAATFITGGTVAEPMTTAPNEIRGKSIQNGETRRLVKGDVIIVPANTPHWFVGTTKPFLYYVVKVR
ncbi:MAG TPA: heme-binding protein [Candidatus Xenobia bacterium]|nr:heme-binding protein [Candidatus Xenobia bacterium]